MILFVFNVCKFCQNIIFFYINFRHNFHLMSLNESAFGPVIPCFMTPLPSQQEKVDIQPQASPEGKLEKLFFEWTQLAAKLQVTPPVQESHFDFCCQQIP